MLLQSIILATSLFTADVATPAQPAPDMTSSCGPRKEAWQILKENEWRPIMSSIMTAVNGQAVPEGQVLQVVWTNTGRDLLVTVEQAGTGTLCMVYRSRDAMIIGPGAQTE
jgi:hypothetical protein